MRALAGWAGPAAARRIGAQRLRPQAFQQLVLRELRRRRQIHESEAPCIIEAERHVALGEEDDMVVDLKLRFARAQEHPAGHAQMADQHLAVVEMDKDVFRPAIDALDPPAREALGEAVGQGKAKVRAALQHPDQPPPLQSGGEPAADGLDFRQLRHGANLACRRAPRHLSGKGAASLPPIAYCFQL